MWRVFLSFWVIPRETTALDYIMCTFPYSKMEKVKNTGSELRHPESTIAPVLTHYMCLDKGTILLSPFPYLETGYKTHLFHKVIVRLLNETFIKYLA